MFMQKWQLIQTNRTEYDNLDSLMYFIAISFLYMIYLELYADSSSWVKKCTYNIEHIDIGHTTS